MTFEDLKSIEDKRPHIIDEILKEDFDSSFITVRDNPIKKGVALNSFRLIIQGLEEFHKDNWDFDYRISSNTISIESIYILFEETEMTNSNGDTHVVRDLLMRLSLLTDHIETRGIGIYNICGTRLTMTKEEITSNYLHSHLTSHNIVGSDRVPFLSFCTGSGEINDYINNFNSSKTKANLQSLLLQLYTLVSWESLEGTPYNYIRDIRFQDSSGSGSGELRPISSNNSSSFVNKVITTFEKAPDCFEFKVSPKDPTDLIVDITELGHKTLIEQSNLQEYLVAEYQGRQYRYQDVVNRVALDRGTWRPRSIPTQPIKFQGVDRQFKIYTEQTEKQTDHDKDSNIEKNFSNFYWDKLKTEIKQRCYTKSSRRNLLERHC